MHLIYNGKLLRDKEFTLTVENRAFTYGDGLFETMTASHEMIHYLDDHFKRLTEGLQALYISIPSTFTIKDLEANILKLIDVNGIKGNSRIKVMAWRKSGGFFAPTSNELEYLIQVFDHPMAPLEKTTAMFYKDIRRSKSYISKYKTISALPYVMAGTMKQQWKVDDVILFDMDDHVAECLNSNIFWIKDKTLYTPSLDTGCIEGIMRKQIFRMCEKHSIEIIEGKFIEEHLLIADFAFTSNAIGIIPLRSIANKKFQPANEIYSILKEELEKR